MTMNTENKKLTRHLKRRGERTVNKNGKKKTLLNKIEKSKKKQNFDRVKK